MLNGKWRPLTRRERVLSWVWVGLAFVLWNVIYDVALGVGIKEYLFRSALHEAGRGPQVAISTVLDAAIFRALWLSTLWASLVLLLGLVTIRALRGHDDR